MLNTVNEESIDNINQTNTRNINLTIRKTSVFSVVSNQNKIEEAILNENNNNPKKIYNTYADFYLKTKRSGSLAIPFNDYVDKQREGL
jgi:hypothetical protein